MRSCTLARTFGVTWAILAGATCCYSQEKKIPTVQVVQPVKKAVSAIAEFSGRIEPGAQVELRARVAGPIVTIAFKEGSEVNKGDLLFEIDPRRARTEVDRADAGLQLAEAKLRIAKAEIARATKLLKSAAISVEEHENAVAQIQVAEASVRLAQIAREAARLQLEWTHVTSPINGRIGRALIALGETAKADETPLAVLVYSRSCYVHFRIHEQSLAEFAPLGEQSVQIAAVGEKDFVHEGKVDFVDNRADPQTGTILVRATLPNEDGRLFPGLSCRVRLKGPSRDALMVPTRCVRDQGNRKILFIVNDMKVEARAVELGMEQDGMHVIRRGLTAGEWVAADRFESLTDGTAVRVGSKSP